MDNEKLFSEIERLYPEYLDVLEDVVNIESPTNFKEGIDAVGNYFVALAERKGWKVERYPQEVAGDVICIVMNPDVNAEPVTLSGHIDTVHPVGFFGSPAAHRDEENMYGPGTIDCKGGVVASFLAMEALDNCGFCDRPIMHILQTDEETGSKTSGKDTIRYICEKAKGSVAFLNTEGNREGYLVLSRKGILRYEFTVHGIAAHSAICHTGANAIAEAAYKIIELEKMKDKNSITCNCGIINGGTVANTVPDTCTFLADIRYVHESDRTIIDEKMRELAEKNTIEGCTSEVRLISDRPSMELCEKNLDLFEKINEISRKVGLPELKSKHAGGGSDAAYVTIAGIPCIDCVGVQGGYLHSPKEYVKMRSLAYSAKLQAAIACYI